MHVKANHGRCGTAVGAGYAIRRAGTQGCPRPQTVHGMLPDFRFVLGAIVAIALLGVAGLGVVTSVRLVREAHMGPLDDSRSLAFAGHSEWNQFYDPEAARRFAGLTGKSESPVAEARPQAPDDESAPPASEERTASIPAQRIDPDMADDKPPEAPHMTETPAVVTNVAPPGEAPGLLTSAGPGPTEADPSPPERLASAPATSAGTELPAQTPMLIPAQPQAAASPLQGSAPAQHPRPKHHFHKKVARAHFRHIARVVQPPQQNPVVWMTNRSWPGYDNQFNSVPTAWKNNGKPIGTPASPP
jgi:hypothetical protein